MQRQRDLGFGGGGFGGGGFGGGDSDDEPNVRDNEFYSREQMRKFIEEFPPEFTDEKRNEWLKWIDERSKKYSIDPVIINRFSKDSKGKTSWRHPFPDVYIYQTNYGTLEVHEQFVENFVTKPVDAIMKARGKRGPLVVGPPDDWIPNVFSPTDPPSYDKVQKIKGFKVGKEGLIIEDEHEFTRKCHRYGLMDLFINQKSDYENFCEDLYENFHETGRGQFEGLDAKYNPFSLDEVTGEICIKLQVCDQVLGPNKLWKTPGKK